MDTTPPKDLTTGKFLPREKAPAEATKEPAEKPPKAGVKEKPQVDISAIETFADTFLDGKSDKPEEKPPDKPVEERPKAEKLKPSEKPKPAPRKAPTPEERPRREMDPEAIAEAAGRGVAKALESRRAETPKPEEKPKSDLPTSEQRKVEVLEQMEKMFPDKYKTGYAQKYQETIKKLIAYAKQWETQNPGKEFNEEDPEHTDFYDKNNAFTNYDQDDYIEALTEIKADKMSKSATEALERKFNDRLSKYERADKLREAAPVIDKEQGAAAKTFWASLGDEFAGVIKEDGTVDSKKLAEVNAKDPVGMKIRLRSANNVDALIGHTYALFNGLIDFNNNDPAHSYLNDFALSKEDALLAKPKEEQADSQGRPFKARQEFNKLSETEQRKYWTFSVRDMAYMIAQHEAASASEIIAQKEAEFEEIATARGLKAKEAPKVAPESEEEPGTVAEDEEAPEPENMDGKPHSPSSRFVPKTAASRAKGAAPATEGSSAFAERFIGG